MENIDSNNIVWQPQLDFCFYIRNLRFYTERLGYDIHLLRW